MPFCTSSRGWVALLDPSFSHNDPYLCINVALRGWCTCVMCERGDVEAYKEAVAQCLTEPLGQPPEAIVALRRTPPERPGAITPCRVFTLCQSLASGRHPKWPAQSRDHWLSAPLPRQGPGPYLNFTLDDGFLGRTCCRYSVAGQHYGHGEKAAGKKVVIYSSPNIARTLSPHPLDY